MVSGLALGIDAAAHEGACATGAPPLAVVAGGLDRPYPARNARLFERVVAQGAVVSESPAGGHTEKWRFPVRNRLLAALSDVVVVVESRHRSGPESTPSTPPPSGGYRSAGARLHPQSDLGGTQRTAGRRLLPGT